MLTCVDVSFFCLDRVSLSPLPVLDPASIPEEALILHPSAFTVMLRSTCCKGL